MKIDQIENKFKNKELFKQALTHRSWINENPGIRGTNERLEFLGDAILEFIVSERIYADFPSEEEGFLTALRSNIVNTQNLSEYAARINLGKHLFLSKGEEQGGGRDNASLLADTVEAIIGAIYIDRGFEAASEFITKNLLADINIKLEKPLKDAKSRLQEMVQSKGFSTPRYKVVEETGPDHNKIFMIEVLVDSRSIAKGKGKSKSIAEQAAAEAALEELAKNA